MQILLRGWTLIVKDAVAARHATQRKHQYAVGARRRSSSIAACSRPIDDNDKGIVRAD